MDSARFDHLTRALARTRPRRALAPLALLALLGAPMEAKNKKKKGGKGKKGKRKQPNPPGDSPPPPLTNDAGQVCLPNGTSCHLLDSVPCCSENCCVGQAFPICMPQGECCTAEGDFPLVYPCCEGLDPVLGPCVKVCSANGELCGPRFENKVCCEGMVCASGGWCCKPVLSECENDLDCCNGACFPDQNGVKRCLLDAGNPCFPGEQCRPGFTCMGDPGRCCRPEADPSGYPSAQIPCNYQGAAGLYLLCCNTASAQCCPNGCCTASLPCGDPMASCSNNT